MNHDPDTIPFPSYGITQAGLWWTADDKTWVLVPEGEHLPIGFSRAVRINDGRDAYAALGERAGEQNYEAWLNHEKDKIPPAVLNWIQREYWEKFHRMEQDLRKDAADRIEFHRKQDDRQWWKMQRENQRLTYYLKAFRCEDGLGHPPTMIELLAVPIALKRGNHVATCKVCHCRKVDLSDGRSRWMLNPEAQADFDEEEKRLRDG